MFGDSDNLLWGLGDPRGLSVDICYDSRVIEAPKTSLVHSISAIFLIPPISLDPGKLSAHVTFENCPQLFPWLTTTARCLPVVLKFHSSEGSML